MNCPPLQETLPKLGCSEKRRVIFARPSVALSVARLSRVRFACSGGNKAQGLTPKQLEARSNIRLQGFRAMW
jgi:hypothetical protein